METTGNLYNGRNDGTQSWIEYLDGEIAATEADSVTHCLAQIIRDTLLSTDESRAAGAAGRIDTHYQEYLSSDPLLKFANDKGTAGFLNSLYELVFDVARLIPYRDALQDILVQLIVELRKLPPKRCKIWDEDALVYTKEPIFTSVLDENWNRNLPSTAGANSQELEKTCAEWVNFSAFLARCIQSNLNDQYEDGCKYPSFDIPKGLEEDHPVGVIRNCLVTVAVVYILLASSKIHYEFVENRREDSSEKRWGLDKWQLWAEKLKKLVDSEGMGSELGDVALEAYRKMVSLHSGLFPVTD
ncbi:MAG: hypothetical protein M1840_007030 [Geoglossum simile]|nr:MAG: hypothetical protein M1840_007030 [Geoglossum simile]